MIDEFGDEEFPFECCGDCNICEYDQECTDFIIGDDEDDK